MNFARFLIQLVAAVIVSVVVSVTVSISLFYVFTHPTEFSRFVHIPGIPGLAPNSAMITPAPSPAPQPAPSAAINTPTASVPASSSQAPAAGAQDAILIGTGGVNGVYYPSGGAICQMLNNRQSEFGVQCERASTKGSVFNIRSIREGAMQVGIAQSDWQYHSYRGSDRFSEDGPFEDLRALFSLHSEAFTVVARADSNIRRFQDLLNMRVNIGSPGSGQRGTMELLMDKMGWTSDSFLQTLELDPAEQSKALCDNVIDAFVYTAGHPNSSIQEATTTCDSVLVEVSGPQIQQLINENPYYAVASIPGGLYPGNAEPVKTFGVKATVVTSSNLPDDTAYAVAKSVFDNIEQMKRMHPSFSTLSQQSMITDGISVPLHDGARRYYQEAGLL